MKTRATAALTLLLCTVFAIPTAALAGKGGPNEDPDRDPSNKVCEFVAVSRCTADIGAAIGLIEGLYAAGEAFISGNPDRDSGTLVCKLTGADIKLAQGKDLEASDAIYMAIEKVYSLEAQGKFNDLVDSTDPDVPVSLKDHLYAAKSCVDNP